MIASLSSPPPILPILLVVVVIVLIAVASLIALPFKSAADEDVNETFFAPAAIDEAPRCIWTYWNGDMPYFVYRCIDSWRKNNPSYKIVVLRKQTLLDYIDVDLDTLRHANDSQARFADFVRLHVLERHGGMWMDASIICNGSIDFIFSALNRPGVEFVGYRADQHTLPEFAGSVDVIESSAFACKPQCAFVRAWRDEFMNIEKYGDVADYVNAVHQSGVNTQGAPTHPYWAVYVAQIAALYRNRVVRPTLSLFDATQTIFSYQFDPLGNAMDNAVRLIYEGRFESQPLIKITNYERMFIDETYGDRVDPLFAP
ncbi:hypothetical protein TSOC_007118 [Tetrabaena socialis]|uniref:Uncharacterized protein n=1 Tax=Tetrabaena socialis TaxID=47790 RepID=A0A2J8A1P3_9CHLO|nr:hypothetical protein TSOC_007118 [Tetrabaena socialis]|eukprot:PNH06449.1 hypothetical protein TSOC_007118 [Tetrabaena socialis]